MQARTTIAAALALLAVAAPAAQARPVAHTSHASNAAHFNIPSDHDGSVATKTTLYRCTVKQGRRTIQVWSHSKCKAKPGGSVR